MMTAKLTLTKSHCDTIKSLPLFQKQFCQKKFIVLRFINSYRSIQKYNSKTI